MKLNLACGLNAFPDFTNVDKVDLPGVDMVYDLEQFPWPFEDNSVEEVFCSHYIEHVPEIIKFMDEIWRVCKDGAIVKFVAPYYTHYGAYADPTHCRVICDSTFLYYSKKWREQPSIRLGYYPIKSDFDVLDVGWNFEKEWDKRSDETKLFALHHYWNVVHEIRITLKANK